MRIVCHPWGSRTLDSEVVRAWRSTAVFHGWVGAGGCGVDRAGGVPSGRRVRGAEVATARGMAGSTRRRVRAHRARRESPARVHPPFALALPVKNALAGMRNTDFYAPGSLLKVELDRGNALAAGLTAPESAIWFEGSPAFEVTDSTRATVIARHAPAGANPLLSGWLLGAQRLTGKAALVSVTRGKGRVILFGFRPQYRGQTMSTLPLVWNALR